MAAAPRRVVLSANSSWNIVNFRAGLIRTLKERGYEPVVLAPADSAAEARVAGLEAERVIIEVDRSGMNPLSDARLLLNYLSILKRLRPVAYLGFTVKPNIYGCIAARWLAIPAIANISGLGTAFLRGGPLRALVAALYRFALARAAVVFFQNPDDLDLFVQRRLVRPDQALPLPGSGVDLARFPQAPLPQGPVTFLFVGRLLGDKGVRELVEAARQLRSRHPDTRVQLLGPLDEGNRTAISRIELEGWMREGLVDYFGAADDVRPFIAKATAVVLPSYREGLPRSLLEAGAMGRPLIATDVPGCRQVVEEGVNGYLCEVHNPQSLAEAMIRFAKLATGERAAMGSASRRRMEAEFSEEVVIGAYLDALGKVARQES